MELREQAKKLFEQGERLKDISDKLNINYNTIKQWRRRDKWKKPRVTVTKKKKGKVTEKVTPQNEPEELTEKQKLFAEIYVRNFNATQAAIKAGYSPRSAFVEGCRLLKHVKVRAYVEELKAARKATLLVSVDDIVERYMRIAFADMTDFVEFGQEEIPIMTKEGPIIIRDPDTGAEEMFKQSVNVVKFKDHDQVDGGLICEIKTSRQGTSIKLENRQKALDWLSEFFDMNPEHKYKRAHDEKKLQLERERLEHQKEMDRLKAW